MWRCEAPAPSSAAAAEAKVCVAPDGEVPEDAGDCVDGTHATIAEALATVAGMSADPPSGTASIRLLGGPSASPHVESLLIDTRGTGLEPQLDLLMDHRPLCPSPDSPPGEPIVRIATNGNSNLSGLNIDLSDDGPCPSARPAVLGWGAGQLGVVASELVGWTGWGVADGLVGEPIELNISGSSIRGGSGSAIRSGNSLALFRTEIVGNRLPAEGFSLGIVWLESASRESVIEDVVFFGNLLENAEDDGRAVLRGQLQRARNVAFIANGLGSRTNLIATGFYEPRHLPGEPVEPGQFLGMTDSVIVRNSHASLWDETVLPQWPEGGFVSTDSSGSLECLGALNPEPYEDRADPFASEELEAGSLIRVDPAIGYPSQGAFVIARSLIVENRQAGGALVDVRLAPGLSMQLIHNTIGGNAGADSAVVVAGGGPDSELVAARNLHVASAPDRTPLVVDEGVGRLFVSMNASVDGQPWSSAGSGIASDLLGPDVPLMAASFRDAEDVRQASPCEQLQERCPGLAADDCQPYFNEVGHAPCALDAAAGWLPSESTAVAMSWAWPWDTDFLPSEVDGADVLGATGWSCAATRGTLDGEPPDGDGDGYPTLFDCDNLDPDVIPGLPELNGVDGPDCDPTDGGCWICPEGTEIDPTDDDDSAVDAPDDDDLTPDLDGGYFRLEDGCRVGPGCGAAWEPSVVWVALFLPLRRKRRGRPIGCGSGAATPPD